MKEYEVEGYDRRTGKKVVITVVATTFRHAKTVAYNYITYPVVLGRVRDGTRR